MRIGTGRRYAGAVSAGAAPAGAGRRYAGAAPAHARFAGEIAGKYGPIRPGVRSGQPLVFRVSSQEKPPKGRERAPFRPPERAHAAGAVSPSRDKPEIRYRDIVRDRPGPAGKDRVTEREKVIERQKLVEREKVVVREKIVERRTVVVREAVRVVVQQRRIREAALAADLKGRSDELPDSRKDGPASAKTAGKARKNKNRLSGNETAASIEEKSRIRETDDGDGDGFGDEAYEVPRDGAGRISFAESLALRTAWPMSAKANAAFRRERDKAAAGKIPLRSGTSGEVNRKQPNVRERKKGNEPADRSRTKSTQPFNAQLLFVNPKLRFDGSASAIGSSASHEGGNRAGPPSSGKAVRQPERLSGSSETNGSAGPGLPHATETRREERLPGSMTFPNPVPPADAERLAEVRENGGRFDDSERSDAFSAGDSGKVGKRSPDRGTRGQPRQEQASPADESSSGLSSEGSRPGMDGDIFADGAQTHTRPWSRSALRLSHALKPGLPGETAASFGAKAERPTSPRGRTEEIQAAQGTRSVGPQPALGGRSWLLRKPGADSPLPLVYRSLAERGLPIAAKSGLGMKAARTQESGMDTALSGLSMRAAGSQTADTDSETSEPVRDRRRFLQAEARLRLAAGSLKLSHRLTGGFPRIDSIGGNASSVAGANSNRSSEKAREAGTAGTGRGTDRGLHTPEHTGEPGRDAAGGDQSPRVHENVRGTGAFGRIGEKGQDPAGADPAPTVHANIRGAGATGRAGESQQSSKGAAPSPTVYARTRGTGAQDQTREGGQGPAGAISTSTVHSNIRGTRAPDRAGGSRQEGSFRAIPIHGLRGTSISGRAKGETGLRIPGSANAELLGAQSRIHQGKIVWFARRGETTSEGVRTSATNRSSPIGSDGALGRRNLMVPTVNLESLAGQRQSSKPLFRVSQSKQARASILLRRGHLPETGLDESAGQRMPAGRRTETEAEAMQLAAWKVQPHDANKGIVDDRQPNRSPTVRTMGRKLSLSLVIADGKSVRTALPGVLAARPFRRSRQNPQLPIQQNSPVQPDQTEAPRLSLAHAALPATGARRDAEAPGNLADSPAHTLEQDAILELRRNSTVTAGGTSPVRNVAPEPLPEISEEALQKAISALPQLNPDQLADQVYKSLMKRMKMEQRLHGF